MAADREVGRSLGFDVRGFDLFVRETSGTGATNVNPGAVILRGLAATRRFWRQSFPVFATGCVSVGMKVCPAARIGCISVHSRSVEMADEKCLLHLDLKGLLPPWGVVYKELDRPRRLGAQAYRRTGRTRRRGLARRRSCRTWMSSPWRSRDAVACDPLEMRCAWNASVPASAAPRRGTGD